MATTRPTLHVSERLQFWKKVHKNNANRNFVKATPAKNKFLNKPLPVTEGQYHQNKDFLKNPEKF